MKASTIFKNEIKPYTIQRLIGLTDSEGGKQVKTYQNISLDLAILYNASAYLGTTNIVGWALIISGSNLRR